MGWVLLHVDLLTPPPRCPQQLLEAPFPVGAAPGLANKDLSRVKDEQVIPNYFTN